VSLLSEYIIDPPSNNITPEFNKANNPKNTLGEASQINQSNRANVVFEEAKELQEIGKLMDEISERDEEFREQVSKAASYFSRNPRELKRFINLLRFQRFVMAALKIQDNSFAFDQVRRWIILCLKWPGLVRWLQTY
jgi:hypothetical protein